MNALIGYTGFVGSNLKSKRYDKKYNSKNIEEIIGQEFDIVVCAGIRAEKFLANLYPEQDLLEIDKLIHILKQVRCKKFVLISTIDIYKNPRGVDENTEIELDLLHPYGLNRYHMEEFVSNYYKDYLIVRLPALFGKGLKKNFIYDVMNKIPTMIMRDKFISLINSIREDKKEILKNSYIENERGEWQLKDNIGDAERQKLIELLEEIQFTSLQFTDYRSEFPFYNLSNLQKDIEIAMKEDIKVLNIAVEPISAGEIAKECFGITFNNTISNKEPVYYDMKSLYANKFHGNNGYMYSKEQTLEFIKQFKQGN